MSAEASVSNPPPTALGTTEDGRDWLAENATDPEVVSLPCGLQYKVVKAAKPGAQSPLIDTPCEVHYTGRTLEGVEFDSSYARGKPSTLPPNRVVQGWTVAMQLMGVGDRWLLALPSELAYGDAGRSDEHRGQYIAPGDVLVFELELLAVKGASKPKPRRPKEPPAGSYMAAASFQGARAGFVFTTREWGPGYYRDKRVCKSSPSNSPPRGEAGAPSSETASETAAAVPNEELFERPPLHPNGHRLSSAHGGDLGSATLKPDPNLVEPKLPVADPLVVLKENLGHAESPLEAVQVLIARLQLPTLKATLEDLGLPAAGSDKTELSLRLTRALTA
jgi:FKBP-type peptidyl-prolyl cis-trans isomerase FklB